ncbi:MAG: hypothetical protein RH859_07125 [Longimicrobiales bacterium]
MIRVPLPAWLERPARAALLAAAVAVVVHAGALGNGFAYDDEVVIAGDPGLRSLPGLPERLMAPYWPDAFGAEVGSWRPLTTAVFSVTWVASGGAPWAFHLVGILLHAAATALVVGVLAALVPAGAAALGGLLFAVHPVHVEAVANVVGTAEAVSAVPALLALLLWLRAPEGPGVGRALAVAALYGLAVLGKEGAVVLPALLFLADAARRDVRLSDLPTYLRSTGPAYALQAAVLALALGVRWSVLGDVASPTHPPGAEVLRDIPRIWTLAGVWPHYVRLLLAPLDLASDYSPGVVEVGFGWNAGRAAGAALALAVMVGAWAAWRRGGETGPGRGSPRMLGFAVVWVLVALLPVANVLFLAPVLVAERTLYLASVGVVGALGWLAWEAVDRKGRPAAVAVAALLLAFAARSAVRVPDWRSTETIQQALLDDHPESGRAWWGFARRLDAEGRPGDARRAYAVAMDLLDSEHQVALDVASHLLAAGRPGQARLFLERAWRERPEWYSAPGLLAAAELASGRPERAAAAARAATVLAPGNPSMHHLLAQALGALDRPADAAAARRASLEAGFADRWRSWYLLAGDLAAAGDTAGARAALDSAAVRAAGPEERGQILRLRASFDPSPS